MIAGLLVDLLVAIVTERTTGRRSRISPTNAGPEPPAITEAREQARREQVARYATWANERGLTSDTNDALFDGLLEGCPARLDTGLRGGSPGAVEVLIEVSVPASRPFLLTASTTSDAELAASPLPALFDHPVVVRSLRSIGVTAKFIRLRFVPRTSPDTLDATLDALFPLLEDWQRAAAHDGDTHPYRGR